MFALINYDIDNVVGVSRSEARLQEVYYDLYMDDLYYEFLWNVNYENQSADEAYLAAYHSINSFYDNYMAIEEVPEY